ncbi:putative membrane protein [Asticcacaulis biprosthecium C19]|uniref:Putative membrane protein n=1 Tax=Asticcacaulis biprosthecium C19 TaxID=715226 RepID=F4QRQ0_9CAUL|nr:putative membrane protein [Asticcacaulis biprosthecium C19]
MDDVFFVLTSGIFTIFGGLFVLLVLSPSSWSLRANDPE